MNILIGLNSEKYDYSPVIMGRIIAEAARAEITVLIMVPDHGHWENGESIADHVIEDLKGLEPEVIIRQGDPNDLYQQQLLDQNYHLVIVHGSRKIGVRKFSEINPIVSRQNAFAFLLTENVKPKLDRMLVASSCKEDDYSLVRKAGLFGKTMGASLTLLHVVSGAVPSMYAGLNQLDETVEEMLQTDSVIAQHLRHAGEILQEMEVESEVKIRRGVPAEEIVRETQLENYDLVVIGTSDVKEGLKSRVLGNLTVKIIDMVELPVLVVGRRALQ